MDNDEDLGARLQTLEEAATFEREEARERPLIEALNAAGVPEHKRDVALTVIRKSDDPIGAIQKLPDWIRPPEGNKKIEPVKASEPAKSEGPAKLIAGLPYVILPQGGTLKK